MKTFYCFFGLFLFTSFLPEPEKGVLTEAQRKAITDSTTTLNPTEITFDKINIRFATKKYKQTKEFYTAFHAKDVWVSTRELLLAHFMTADQHMGVITYCKEAECDQQYDQYYLYIVDKNGTVSQPFMIWVKDNGIVMWEVNFKFLSESTILLSEKTSSEWAIDDPSGKDTIFSTRYRIDFTKTPFDTLKTERSQKIIPPNQAVGKDK